MFGSLSEDAAEGEGFYVSLGADRHGYGYPVVPEGKLWSSTLRFTFQP